MTVDFKNLNINTPLEQYEYMKIPVDLIHKEEKNEFNLHHMDNKRNKYMEIQQGMYGLKQDHLTPMQ